MINKPIPAALLDKDGDVKTWVVNDWTGSYTLSSSSLWSAFCRSVNDWLNTHAFAEHLGGVGAGRVTDRGLQLLKRAGVIEFVHPPARPAAASQSPESIVAHGEHEARFPPCTR